MRAEPPVISVVIVSYNTREMTLRCLRTLRDEIRGTAAEVIVVDNASADGSVEAIRAAMPDVQVIASDKNEGFGAANNRAMRQARGRYFLLLNSDAFPKPGAIDALVRYLDAHPDVAVVGPRLSNEDGTLQRSCYRYPSPRQAWLENLWISGALPARSAWADYGRWAHDQERYVDFVVGACMLVRREVYERVGGFDERFFMYSEETDWQRRMTRAGGKIAFTPAAEVVHLGGASGASEPARINRHFFESLDYYERKHHGWVGLLSLRLAMIVGCSLRACLWSVLALVAPGRRRTAHAKARKHLHLALRQATHWRLG